MPYHLRSRWSSRWPYADVGLETRGDGGGTVVSSCWATFSERWLRGLSFAAAKALAMSSVEKESLRGSCGWLVGSGMAEVIAALFVSFGVWVVLIGGVLLFGVIEI